MKLLRLSRARVPLPPGTAPTVPRDAAGREGAPFGPAPGGRLRPAAAVAGDMR
ncbi:hypothetical protein [Teichococcus rhizosphaerae]|uniref:hypothetical protein n=1 Tax=Teichococcus rhizosphaerae TaxID=1335062 RepID=UPI00159BE94A|nr:hypothetical protein [Pseudoroseomonas rhizosphaerae]